MSRHPILPPQPPGVARPGPPNEGRGENPPPEPEGGRGRGDEGRAGLRSRVGAAACSRGADDEALRRRLARMVRFSLSAMVVKKLKVKS